MNDLDTLIELIEAAGSQSQNAGYLASKRSNVKLSLERLGLDSVECDYILRKVYGL